MAESIIVSHPPAMKVGGRRLSISKHKAHTADTHHASSSTTNKTTPKSDEDDTDPAAARPDYPRPAAPTGAPTANVNADDAPPPPHTHQHQHQHQHNEDEAPPKKDRNEKKLQELPHWKLETTRPTRDNIHSSGSKGHAMGIRIAQPAGKALGV